MKCRLHDKYSDLQAYFNTVSEGISDWTFDNVTSNT